MHTTDTPAPDPTAAAVVPIGFRDGTPYYYSDAVCQSCGAAYGYGCC